MTDLEELKRLAEAATPGPWKWWTSNSWKRLKHDDYGITRSVIEPYVCRDGHPDMTVSEDDMAFIAAANPQAILSLIQREREREAEATSASCRDDEQLVERVERIIVSAYGSISANEAARACISECYLALQTATPEMLLSAHLGGIRKGRFQTLKEAAKECDRRASNTKDFDRYDRRAAGALAAAIRGGEVA